MPDITMCINEKCVKRFICKRHEDSGTKPSEWQSYAEFDNNNGECVNFILNTRQHSNLGV